MRIIYVLSALVLWVTACEKPGSADPVAEEKCRVVSTKTTSLLNGVETGVTDATYVYDEVTSKLTVTGKSKTSTTVNTYSYDSNGRLIEASFPGSYIDLEQYKYDSEGRLAEVKSRRREIQKIETTTYQYKNATTIEISIQGYNPAGNPISRTNQITLDGKKYVQKIVTTGLLNGQAFFDRNENYTYDEKGRIILIQNVDEKGSFLSSSRRVYDAEGNYKAYQKYAYSTQEYLSDEYLEVMPELSPKVNFKDWPTSANGVSAYSYGAYQGVYYGRTKSYSNTGALFSEIIQKREYSTDNVLVKTSSSSTFLDTKSETVREFVIGCQ